MQTIEVKREGSEACTTIMRLIGLNDAETVQLIEADRTQTATTEPEASGSDTEVRGNMAAPRRKLLRCIKIMLVVTALGTVFTLVRVHYLQTDNVLNFSIFVPRVYKIDDVVKLQMSDNTLSFSDSTYGQFLKFKFTGEELNTAPALDSCLKILGKSDVEFARKQDLGFDPFMRSVCLKWKNTVLVLNDTRARGSRCFSVRWTTSRNSSPENCVSLSGAHWYGGSLLRDQQWPLEGVSIPMQPFISSPHSIFQTQPSAGDYGPVLERLWINSKGFGIVADGEEPLHVSVNAQHKARLCLKTQQREGEGDWSTKQRSPLSLSYVVCMDRTARHVHQHLLKSFLSLPTAAPSPRLMHSPLWSTRGINVHTLTQQQALALQLNVSKVKFPHSQFYIAGNVSRAVGGLFFDHQRFPNAHQMTGEMKFAGFSVSTSVLPFMEKGFYEYEEGAKLDAFLDVAKDQTEHWKNKALSLIDFTNPEVCEWMKKRLTSFQAESSVSAFRFEGGEGSLLSKTSSPPFLPLPSPSLYSQHLARFAHSLGNDSIVSVGYRSQHLPLMVDLGARHSSWEHKQGLKSVIPSVLTLGILGYPFVLVGPVGGVRVERFEERNNSYALPEEELYIRWLQLSIHLPGLEMSVGPWRYSPDTVQVVQTLLQHREDNIVPLLQTAVKEFLRTGAPIIRPLWWMAWEDETAYTIHSQFLISNKILVAPILQTAARRRDVYLPKVKDLKWKDALRGQVYAGGQWLRGFKVALSEVATFTPVLKSHTDYHLQH